MRWRAAGLLRARLLAYVVPVLVATAAVPFWFEPGKVIAAGDIPPPIEPTTQYRSHWNGLATGEGGPSFSISTLLYQEPLRAAVSLGVGEEIFQRVWLGSLVAACAAAAVFFTFSVSTSPLAAGLAGIFASLNSHRLVTAHDSVALMTLLMAALLGGLVLRAALRQSRRPSVLVFALASLGLSLAFANPPQVAIVALWVGGLVAIAGVVGGSGALRAGGVFLAKAAPLVLAVNVWWIVPAALTVTNPAFDAQFAAQGVDEWEWTHARANWENVVALQSGWMWADPTHLPYVDRLSRAPFDVLRYVLPALAVVGIVLARPRERRLAIGLGVACLVLIWIGKGVHPPLTSVARWAYDTIPGYWLFRDPGKPLLLLSLALACLAGIGVARLLAARILPPPVPATLAGLLTLAALAYAHPLLTGEVTPGKRESLPSAHVRVPDEWRALIRFLNAQPSAGKLLVLPSLDFYQAGTTWGYYGAPFERYAIDRPVIEPLLGGYFATNPSVAALVKSIENDLRSGGTASIPPKLRALGVPYVLVRNDLARRGFTGEILSDTGPLQRGIRRLAGAPTRSFGQLELYTIQNRATEVFAATPLAFTGPAALVPEVLDVRPDAALVVPPGERPWSPESSTVRRAAMLEPPGPWRVAVRDTGGSTSIRFTAVRKPIAGPPRLYASLPRLETPFALAVGPYAFLVREIVDAWTSVGTLPAGRVDLGVWQPTDAATARLLSSRRATRSRASVPEVSYERLSPVEFSVRVTGASGPFLLTLGETYAAGWQVESRGRDSGDLRHVEVNGYANGWMIPWRGSYDLAVKYRPERWALLARWIGLIAVALTILAWIGLHENVRSKLRRRVNGLRLRRGYVGAPRSSE